RPAHAGEGHSSSGDGLERFEHRGAHRVLGGGPMSDASVIHADLVDTKVVLSFLADVQAGDYSARMPLDWTGLAGKVADGLNDVVIANQTLEGELDRVCRAVGREGKLSQR